MSELISGKDKMKTAEFLNTKANYMLQVLPEHAGDDPESGLVRVPEGMNVAWKDDNSIWFTALAMGYRDAEIVWQRTTLQQKVNEVRQHLGITNNNTLSVMIGREKSYLRKLLKRKVSAKTQDKVTKQLDALMIARTTIDSACSEAEEQARMIEDRLSPCGQCVIKNTVIQQENDNAEIWLEKYSKLKSAFNCLTFLAISIFISWVILAYEVLYDLA